VPRQFRRVARTYKAWRWLDRLTGCDVR
jgi:hypothetical protein